MRFSIVDSLLLDTFRQKKLTFEELSSLTTLFPGGGIEITNRIMKLYNTI